MYTRKKNRIMVILVLNLAVQIVLTFYD